MTLSITLWVCYRRAKLAPPASNFSGVQFPMYSADYFAHPATPAMRRQALSLEYPRPSISIRGFDPERACRCQGVAEFRYPDDRLRRPAIAERIFYAEQATEGISHLNDIRSDPAT